MEKFKILNGRGSFYQWDFDQKLAVLDDTVTEVHFPLGSESCPPLPVYELGGQRVVDVPNILLQTDGMKRVYAFVKDAFGGRTICTETFRVNARAKPDDYIYTETERWTAEKAVQKALQEAKDSGAFKGDPGPKGDPGVVKFVVVAELPETDTENAIYLVPVTDSTKDILLSESAENNYEKLTFSDFGIADGQILNQNSGHSVSPVLEGDLDEVLFRGKFLFPTLESGKKFGNIYIGLANWWGLTLTQDNNGNILVNVTSTGSTIENLAATNMTVNSPVELRNNPDLELAFSVKYENKTATTTDLKIGVWINGVLQPGGYIIVKNATLSELTRCFHTYDSDANSSVTVASVGEVTKPKDNLFDEYIFVDGKWEKIGSTAVVVDMSGYVKNTGMIFANEDGTLSIKLADGSTYKVAAVKEE